MLERLEMTDGLGAIYPAMLNAIIALRCLGYSEDDPQVIRARDEFEKLGIEQPPTADMPEPTFRMQPCRFTGVGYGAGRLCAGRGRRPAQRPAHGQGRRLDALQGSSPQRRLGGKVPKTEPGGWYFEFNNEFYPDTDDTAQVLLALNKVDNPRERYQHQVARAPLSGNLAMQCRSGGWGSFDKDNTKMIFQYIPFADHNAMLDPPDGGHHWAHARDARDLWLLHAKTSASRRPSSSSSREQEAGRKLVWPLGRELHLRHVSGAARA